MKYKNYYSTPKYSDGDKSYYGSVSGVPEIPMITAGNLDDYERLFHQAVDDYLGTGGKNKVKPGWVIAAAICVLLAVMAMTCPKKEKHVEVLTDRFSYVLNDHLSKDDSGLEFLSILFGGAVTKPLVNNFLSLDDYFFFNVGKLSFQGEDHAVTFGAFGHVFAPSREAFKKRIEENPDLQELLESLQ